MTTHQNLLFPQYSRTFVQLPCLPRCGLVEKLNEAVESSRFVLLSPPSSYGITTLMNLFILRYSSYRCIMIPFDVPGTTANDLVAAHGVDIQQKTFCLSQDVSEGERVIFLLDDTSSKYEDKEFWTSLIETSQWLPGNVRFVISVIHLLIDGAPDIPDVIADLPCKLTKNDFLLENEEALGLFADLPNRFFFPKLPKQLLEMQELIIRDCNGHVGALVNAISELFCAIDFQNEEDLMSYYMSDDFVKLERLFSARHMTPNPRLAKVLSNWLTGDLICSSRWKKDNKSCFDSLEKAGIIAGTNLENMHFTSRLAQRYYTKWLFPDRGVDNPSSLHSLIRDVLGNMSMSLIHRTIHPDNNFPVKAWFLRHFMTGLLLFTIPSCPILQDTSPTLPSTTHRVGDEFDFYIGDGLQWGIDVRLNGENINELETRLNCTETNKVLPIREFVIVDIRGTKTGEITNLTHTPNRVTVFFKMGDFSRCWCVFGQNKDPELITLRM